MTINWSALLQVSIATIVVAVAIGGLMSLANWLLLSSGENQTVSPRQRLAGYAVIGLIVLIVLGGLYVLVSQNVARLLSQIF